VVIRYIFLTLVCLNQEKSGNPEAETIPLDQAAAPGRQSIAVVEAKTILEPILRLLNLQLQRQRCSSLEHFISKKNIFYSKNVPSY
jgi:hypothetical protein